MPQNSIHLSAAHQRENGSPVYTYVIGDIHGRFDLLQLAIAAIVTDESRNEKRIITLGDYIDRGPDSAKVVDLLAHWDHPKISLKCLMGNHEEMLVLVLNGLLPLSEWRANGADATLGSYGISADGAAAGGLDLPDAHAAWLSQLPSILVDSHRIYVHAGADPNIPIEDQGADVFLWMRYAPGHNGGHGSRHVVHGHTPFFDGPMLYSGRTNLDVGAFASGRLVVAVFDDSLAGGPIKILEVQSSAEM